MGERGGLECTLGSFGRRSMETVHVYEYIHTYFHSHTYTYRALWVGVACVFLCVARSLCPAQTTTKEFTSKRKQVEVSTTAVSVAGARLPPAGQTLAASAAADVVGHDRIVDAAGDGAVHFRCCLS